MSQIDIALIELTVYPIHASFYISKQQGSDAETKIYI